MNCFEWLFPRPPGRLLYVDDLDRAVRPFTFVGKRPPGRHNISCEKDCPFHNFAHEVLDAFATTEAAFNFADEGAKGFLLRKDMERLLGSCGHQSQDGAYACHRFVGKGKERIGMKEFDACFSPYLDETCGDGVVIGEKAKAKPKAKKGSKEAKVSVVASKALTKAPPEAPAVNFPVARPSFAKVLVSSGGSLFTPEARMPEGKGVANGIEMKQSVKAPPGVAVKMETFSVCHNHLLPLRAKADAVNGAAKDNYFNRYLSQLGVAPTPANKVDAVIPETAADAARDEKEIHDVDPPDEKEDEKDDEPGDERDDAQDDRKDDPHENVETMEQANIASEDGVDAHSEGDLKHELDEENETLNLHGNPEEETAGELVDNSPADPKEPDIVEAMEDPDAPHADSTEYPSNENPMERSSRATKLTLTFRTWRE
eukprot:symbB.v1.2.031083.t1/scaffold3512.1/size84356/4